MRDDGFENLLGCRGSIYLGSGLGLYDYRDVLDDVVRATRFVCSRGDSFRREVEEIAMRVWADYYARLCRGDFDQDAGLRVEDQLWKELYLPIR